MTFKEAIAKIREEQAKARAIVDALPEDFRAVRLQDDARMMIVTRSAQKPGVWQLTSFTRDGEPWSHSNYETGRDAVASGLGLDGESYGLCYGSSRFRIVEVR